MSTMQDVIDLARIDLNDSGKVRWPDFDLLKHANAAVRQSFEMRPDLRLGSFATPFADLALAGEFPLPGEYFRAVADYIVARANAVDNEVAETSRSSVFMGSFDKQMVGI